LFLKKINAGLHHLGLPDVIESESSGLAWRICETDMTGVEEGDGFDTFKKG
jgi:hypothetical protein